MDIERVVDIAAPQGTVWSIMSDVERWPEWTASVARVERLDTAPLAVGSRVRIHQPYLPTAVWTVDVFDPPRFFQWRSVTPGLTSVAGHRIEATGPTRSRATLSIAWSGWLAPVIRLLYGGLSRRYVEMEAHGLERRSETHQ
jgi:uncharacterized membrane protein